MEYYGVIKEVIEWDYYSFMKYVIFKCYWFDVNSCNCVIKVDEYGFTFVNTYRFLSSMSITYSLYK